MGRGPGRPGGAGLPRARQEMYHSPFVAPLGLGGASGSLPAAEDSAYQAASLIPLSRAAQVTLAHLLVTLQEAPAQASGGGGTLSWRTEEARGIAVTEPGHCF